jgi:dipeptide/tripeptide permease
VEKKLPAKIRRIMEVKIQSAKMTTGAVAAADVYNNRSKTKKGREKTISAIKIMACAKMFRIKRTAAASKLTTQFSLNNSHADSIDSLSPRAFKTTKADA